MRRALSVWLANWPITRLKRRLGPAWAPGAQGLALAARAANTRLLAAVDEIAAANGAFVGQAAADAQAILPGLKLLEAEPEEDSAALLRLAHWCARFSPSVAVDAPDGLLLDVEGCAHLWGGEEAMARAIVARLAAQAIPARAALADTFAAAWALARFAAQDEPLADLPVAALRIEPGVRDGLARLGLKRIGDVLALPRASLRKRFGAGLMLRLAYLLGEADEPVAFLHPPAPWRARAVFAEPISRPQDIESVMRDLAGALCARLDGEGMGARRFTLAFHRVDGESLYRHVGASLPLRDGARLAALFAPKLEDVDPGFGVEVMALTAEGAAPARAAQADLIAPTLEARNADLAPLLDRWRNRLGADNVWRAAPFASYAPERAVRAVAALAPASAEAWPADRPRPIRLFKRPHPIEAVAPVPDDPPLLFRWRGRTHRIVRAEGPERIAAEWWRSPWGERGAERVRDYYRVEDEAGARFWLFRAGLYGGAQAPRWFLHGLFA